MATTTNLAVTKIDSAQAQKEVTANQAFDVFDAALSEIAITMTDANYTLSTSTVPQEWQYKVIKLTGTLTAGRNVIVPTNKKEYTIVNATTGGYALTVKTSGGTGIAVSNGVTSILRCDGTNVEAVTPGAGVGSGTVTSVNITQPAAGITASGGPITSSGSITLALADDLAALEGLSGTGIVERTASNTYALRTRDTDGTLAANSDTVIPSQKAVKTYADGILTTTTEGALINGATSKTTPVDADYIGLMDSAASNVLKKLSWANLKATLKTYFDTLYAPLTQPFTVALFYPGVPTASVCVGTIAAPAGITTITYASSLTGSAGKALTAATAQTDFDVRKNATTSANGTSVGTVRFAASGTVPTFIAASGFTLTGGTDYLTIWAPATPDATLANIGITLYATR